MNKTPQDIQRARRDQFKKYAKVDTATYNALLQNAQADGSMASAKIYYPTGLFTAAESVANDDQTEGSLHRAITKNMAIDIVGNKYTMSQGEQHSYNPPYFNANVTAGTPQYAIAKTPKEILKSGFMVRASKVKVFATGGYGHNNPRQMLQPAQRFDVIMVSVAGIALDNAFTDQMLVGIDPVRNAQAKVAVLADNVAIRLPSYQEARTALDQAITANPKDANNNPIIQNADYAYIQRKPTGKGSPYLTRSAKGYRCDSYADNQGNAPADAVILNKKLYRDLLAKRIELGLYATCDQAGPDAQILLKAVLLGGGCFGSYGWGDLPKLNFLPSVQEGYSLYSILINQLILDAWKQGLESFCKNQPTLAQRINTVEFPLYSRESKIAYRQTWKIPAEASLDEANIQCGHIKIAQKTRDALVFTDEEKQNYTCAVLNPADANAEPANELKPQASLEAELGADSTLGLVQSHIFNPNLPTQTQEVDLQLDQIGIQPAASFLDAAQLQQQPGPGQPASPFRFAHSRQGKLFNAFGFIGGIATALGSITAIVSALVFLFAPGTTTPFNPLPHTELLSTALVTPALLALGVIFLAALVLGIAFLVLNSKKSSHPGATDIDENPSINDENPGINTKPHALQSGFANFLSKVGIFVGFPLAATLITSGLSMGLFQLGIKPFISGVESLSHLPVNPSVLLSVAIVAAVTFVLALAATVILYFWERGQAKFESNAAHALRGEGVLFPLQDMADTATQHPLHALHEDHGNNGNKQKPENANALGADAQQDTTTGTDSQHDTTITTLTEGQGDLFVDLGDADDLEDLNGSLTGNDNATPATPAIQPDNAAQ